MRHGDKNNNLSRTASHRKALLSNLTCQLFKHKKIVTTLAKAKALRPYAEPLITKAKENTTHQRRIVFSYLQDKEAIKELFDVISPKIASRPGGYTRVIKLGKRVGDNAEIAMIELVDYNEIYGKGIGTKDERTVKKTRRAGGARKKASTVPAAEKDVAESTKKKAKPREKKKEVVAEKAETADVKESKPAVIKEKEDILKPGSDKGKKAAADTTAEKDATDSTEKKTKSEEKKKEVAEEKVKKSEPNESKQAVAGEKKDILKPGGDPIGIETPEEDATK